MKFSGCWTVYLVSVVACSSSSDDDGPCAQRTGTYVTQFKTRSGDCGALGESIQTLDKQPTAVDPPCSGKLSYSADNCRVTLEQTCPADSIHKGAKITLRGVADWARDGSSGKAIVEIYATGVDGRTLCQGTYDMTTAKR